MVNETKFGTGDLVELKSGSPVMTVALVNSGELTSLVFWNDTENIVERIQLETSVLVKVSSE